MNVFSIGYLPLSQQYDAWRSQMKSMRQDLEKATDAITSTLGDAAATQTTGLGNIYAKMAATRLATEAAAKAVSKQRLATPEWSVWDNPTPANTVDAGNSSIDLSNNTLTLSDGTIIDLVTGVKKVNLVV